MRNRHEVFELESYIVDVGFFGLFLDLWVSLLVHFYWMSVKGLFMWSSSLSKHFKNDSPSDEF